MIEGIKGENIEAWWSLVEEYLITALEHGLGEYSIGDIKKSCKSRDMQLWVKLGKKVEGTFVTKIARYPQKNILVVLLLGGDNFKEWKDEADKLLLSFGKENKCEYVEIFGRKGWSRELSNIGYKEQTRLIAKEII